MIGKCSRLRGMLGVVLCLVFSIALRAHEGGPPTLTLDAGQVGTYVIKSDATSEGELSFYLAHAGYDTNVIRVNPLGTFSSLGDGEFIITGLAPGTTTVTFGWLYPPHDAGGLFTCQVTVRPPAAAPPSAANAVTSATTADPVNLFSGEFTMMEPPDLSLGGPMPLYFARYYGSGLGREALLETPLGDNWSHNFNWRLLRDGSSITVVSWEGRRIVFQNVDFDWHLTGAADIPFQLVENGGLFLLADPRDDRIYTFNAGGELESIADGHGNTHTLKREGGRLTEVSDGLGRVLKFNSGGFQQLLSVSDGTRMVTFGYTNIVVAGLVNNSFRIFDQYSTLGSVRNPMGNTTAYTYDTSRTSNHVRALIRAKVRPLGNIPYAQTWDAEGKVASQSESGTNTHTFSYDRLTTTITDPLGRTRRTVHSAGGQLASIVDEVGDITTITSNTNGQRVLVTDRRQGVTRFAYHGPSGKVAAQTNALGAVIRFEFALRTVNGLTFYDLSRIIYPDGATEDYSYDGNGNVTALKDRAGKIWRMTYNQRGQVLTVRNPLGGLVTYSYHSDGTVASRADSDSEATRYVYDSFRRMTNAVRADGFGVGTRYDLNDRVTAVTDERGNTYEYKYDLNDNLIQVIDPNGRATTYSYDKRDRVAKVTDRSGKSTEFSYDSLENLATIRGRNGNLIKMGYDARQRLSTLINPAGGTWGFKFNSEGVIESWSNPLGETQAQQSDLLGYAVGSTDSMGKRRTVARNSLQLPTAIVDELSRTNLMSYDSRGLLGSVAKPVMGMAQIQRNSLGAVTRLTDPSGNRWLWEHTPMGRIRLETDPLNRSTHYEYDARGRLMRTTYPDGASRENTFDARNNPGIARYSDGTELRFVYDSLNRLTEVNDLILAYDAESRITSTVSSGVTYGAEYDDGGRLVSAVYDSGKFAVAYEYDNRDRLTRVSDSLSGTVLNLAYDEAGRMTTVTRPNGVNGTYTYDAVGRLTRIQEGNVIDLGLTLDSAGQVTELNFKAPLDPSGFVVSGTTTFTYDSARQINNGGYKYDARGRMTSGPDGAYSYDGASRLIRAGTVQMTYNGLGDVVSRAEGGVTTRYSYNYALGRAPVVSERITSGAETYYVWTPAGRLLYSINAATKKAVFYHFDQVGSTLALTDDRGNVSDAYAYSPYGRLLAHSGTSQQPFTYIGRYGVRREGGNLYQMHARYYSAVTGSFLTRDPLPPRWDDLHSLNPYHYAAGDPLRSVDPEGLDRTIWFFGHAWIEVDVYNAQGQVTGRVALNFAPEWGKSDYQVLMPRNIVYPHLIGYDMKSSQLDDELLVEEWRRLQRDQKRGQQWNPIKNCVWRSIEYANAEFAPSEAQVKKLLARTPVRTDVVITAAPPGPWYKRAYNFIGDTWGDFENWLEKALE